MSTGLSTIEGPRVQAPLQIMASRAAIALFSDLTGIPLLPHLIQYLLVHFLIFSQ